MRFLVDIFFAIEIAQATVASITTHQTSIKHKMTRPNNVLLLCNRATAGHCLCSEQCRQHSVENMVLYRQEDALSDEFESVINFEQEHLDDMWRVTVQKLVTGYSLYIKATRRSLLTSFGPAMNNVPVYMAMTEEERKRLCRDVNQIKRVWQQWPNIINNLTHPAMIYVDVRRFSISALESSKDFDWVMNYNISHGPKQGRPADPAPHFSSQKINTILSSIDNTGILNDINFDDEQIKLIGKALLKGMLERSQL